MPEDAIAIKSIPRLRVAELTGIAGGFDPEHIGPVVKALFGDLMDRLSQDGIDGVGPAVAFYDTTPVGGEVIVHAGIPVGPQAQTCHDFAVVDLPEIPRAATLVHRGPMDHVLPAWHSLEHWIDASGYCADGPARERYLVSTENPGGWVTELQVPITRE